MVDVEVFWYRARIEVNERATKFFDYKKRPHEAKEKAIHRDTL